MNKIIIFCIIMCLFSVASVCASDVNDTVNAAQVMILFMMVLQPMTVLWLIIMNLQLVNMMAMMV